MKNLLIPVFIFFSLSVVAQADTVKKDTSYWHHGGIYGLSFTQVSLTNWAAGGQNSIAVNSIVNLFCNYKKNKTSFETSLDLAYGLINQARMPWWDKSDDKIDLSLKFGHAAFKLKHWYYSALVNFKTQFSPGYNKVGVPLSSRNVISDFLAPGYLIVALGLDFKPTENFSILIAPLTGKSTIVTRPSLADAGAFGVDKAQVDANGVPIPGTGKTTRSEFGGYLKMMYKVNIMQNITLTTKVDLFSNYLNNPGNIDINWETLIMMKINKYISATLNTVLLYDDDINIARDPDELGVFRKNGPVTQFKEVFSLGFNYKF